ncbi:SRPBCC domain-containing protein [Nocardia sp. R7R-8]|uniref:SRPBCC domain-containing protein n=1 Tax=Nocardia sp. R7R-8 TaxID=3459304 RepID=UPI00403E3233
MKLTSRFEVPAPPDKVVALFFDPATMRECLPGCEEFEQVDETTYRGTLVNEIAHVKFKAVFSAVITSVEEAGDGDGASTVSAILKGEDRRLGSTIKIDARLRITPQGEASAVDYELEMAMWGKLGRLGEAVIRRRSIEVERQFAENVAAVCAGRPVPHTGAKPAKNQAPVAGVSSATTAVAAQPAELTGPVASRETFASGRGNDLPFLVAVAAAAFAWGVVIGGWRRAR